MRDVGEYLVALRATLVYYCYKRNHWIIVDINLSCLLNRFFKQIRENLKMLVPDAPRQTCRGRIRLKIVWDQKEKDKVKYFKI